MAIEILPATETDLQTLEEIAVRAFASGDGEEKRFNEFLYPSHKTETTPITPAIAESPAVPKPESERVKSWKPMLSDPTIIISKAVETLPLGQTSIVGWTKWHIYVEGLPPPTPRPPYDRGCNEEACKRFNEKVDGAREKLMVGKPCCVIMPVIVDVGQQRKGIGTKLMKDGLAQVEKYRIPVFLQASPLGYGMYKKCGFRDLEALDLDFSDLGWGGGIIRVWAMIKDVEDGGVE